MLFRHRNLLRKPSTLTITIAAAGIGIVAAASSVAAVTWPSGAGASAATASAYLPGASHGIASVNVARTRQQLQTFKTEVAWRAQLAAAAKAERVAAARRAAARRAAAARAAAHRAALLAAQRQAQQARQAQPPSQPQQPPPPAPAAPPVQAPGSAQHIAMAMLGSYGWSSGQFSCLDSLWSRESGWNVTASNPDGAYGIPQAMPGSKMASAGADWQTSAATQIRWGLGYIRGLYGSPCGAWSHEEATGSY